MSSQTPMTDMLKKVLAEVNTDTGKTNWELILEVVKEKADSGDSRFAKLLERAKGVQDANPEFRGHHTELRRVPRCEGSVVRGPL